MKHDSPEAAEPSPEVIHILEKYLEELEQGGHPSPEALLARHPHLAEPLKGCLASLDFLCRGGQTSRFRQSSETNRLSSGSGPTDNEQPDNGPGQLGDFRILRQVGRGGMGVVYEAEQISLRRRVALKVLPFAGAMDPKLLQRFRNEAQAAAGLHHANIVPVYDIGSDRNVHYYAMQFIDGRTLAALIDDLRQQQRGGTVVAGSGDAATPGKSASQVSVPSVQAPEDADFVLVGENSGAGPAEAASLADTMLAPTLPVPEAAAFSTGQAKATLLSLKSPAFFRRAAELGRQGANALEYAHARGVIHRDIKPSNLLIDNQNNLWIADFGLARLPTDLSLTLSGDFLGTLPYMSPEQALGEHALVDQRTDVYSLGMTLYELLTLQVAFGGGSREELLRQIAFDEPRPLRKLNAAVPKDLETIVLKAIAKCPEERYATAQELADDLTRFLEDHPIRARRPTLEQRLGKLVKRHRRVVWTIGACLFVGMILSLFALGYHNAQISAQNVRVKKAFDKETKLRQRAEANANLAVQALDEIVMGTGKAFFTPVEERDEKGQLRKALRLYRQVVETNDNIPRLEWGQKQLQIGSTQRMVGEKKEEVEATLGGAIRCFQELATAFPAEPTYRDFLAQAYAELGLALGDVGKSEEGLRALDKTHELYQELAKGNPSYAALATNYLVTKGILLKGLGRFKEAETVFHQCLEQEATLPPGCPLRDILDLHRSAARYNLATLFRATGRLQEAEESLRQVLDTLNQLQSKSLNPYEYSERLGTTYHDLAVVLQSMGKTGQAERTFGQALAVQEKLVQEFSSFPEHRLNLACSQQNLAALLSARGRSREADEYFETCQAHFEKLTARHPHVTLYQSDLAVCYGNRGIHFQRIGKAAMAEDYFRKAVAAFQKLAAETDAPHFRAELANCHNNLGEFLQGTGELKEAETAHRQALDLFTHLPADFTLMPEFQSNLATTYHDLAHVHLAKGELKSAWQFALQALAYHVTALGKSPNNPEFRRLFNEYLRVFGQLLSRQTKDLWLAS